MTPAPEQGVRAVVGSMLCVLATWASLMAMTGLVAGRRWFVVSCVAVLVVAGAVTLARAGTRRWWAPSAIGAAVALVGLVLRYGAPPGRPQFLPDLDAVARAWATVRQGAMVVYDSQPPMPDVRPAEMLLVVGALTVYLLLDAAVLALRFPAVGGLPLLALWIPAVAIGQPAGAAAIFWAAAGYLALLAFGAAPLHAQAGRLQRVVTAAVAAALLAGTSVVAAPTLMDVPGWASVALPTFGDGPVGPLELSDDLDLRESLGARSGQVVLSYTVTDPFAPADAESEAPSPTPEVSPSTPEASPSAPVRPAVDARLVGPLRAFTMASFDGRRWLRAEAEDLVPWVPELLLSSDPQVANTVPDPGAGTIALMEVEVEGLRERRLPVSTFPRTVAVDGSWGYDPLRDEVVGQRSTGTGLTYSMLVQVPTLTSDDLEATGVGTPPDAEVYTAVPDTDHREDIAALTAEITADATSPYDQALDLQTWLRSAANFTYDTRVPPARTSDAVWDFLEDRRGYCVQFATAMAVMARTLDIPSRIGVGFLPGERTDDGSYVVTGRLAHAWPELYFDGLGWVRFEPTPATQSGPPPAWADPSAGFTAPDSIPQQMGANPPAVLPSDAATAPSTVPQEAAAGRSPWTVPVIVGGLVLVLAGAALVVLLLRRRRRRRVATPEDAWTTLRRGLARADVRWSDATSPRGAVRQVEGAIAVRTGVDLDGAARESLERLARVVEQTRYAPAPTPADAGELDAWVTGVLDGVQTALATDRPRATTTPP